MYNIYFVVSFREALAEVSISKFHYIEVPKLSRDKSEGVNPHSKGLLDCDCRIS